MATAYTRAPATARSHFMSGSSTHPVTGSGSLAITLSASAEPSRMLSTHAVREGGNALMSGACTRAKSAAVSTTTTLSCARCLAMWASVAG